jgi:RNA-directed DNA polymerase
VLNAIYEEDFVGFSYGFRPGRSQHSALDALAVGICRKRVNWVFDADIRDFFGTIDHGWMRKFLEHRVADRRLLRLIQKWLSAGVLQDGVKTVEQVGTPQGASVSPLLANIYLHYVFDLWTESWRRKCARGDVVVVRFADDIALGFQYKSDAERYWAALADRLAKFSLSLQAEKTRLIRFGVHARRQCKERGEPRPRTFDFLGFTHICSRSRAGRFLLLRHTITRRMRITIRAIRARIMKMRHLPIHVQGAWLRSVVRGYNAYFAVPTNSRKLALFRNEVIRAWFHALRRRTQRHRWTWKRMLTVIERWIPRARILHPWPSERFDARTQGRSPVR